MSYPQVNCLSLLIQGEELCPSDMEYLEYVCQNAQNSLIIDKHNLK